MQGKETSVEGNRPVVHVGLDVSEQWLDAHLTPSEVAFRVPNTDRGRRDLVGRLAGYVVERIAIEATGKWHRPAHRVLHDAGYAVAIVDPRRARLFAGATGFLAKTDRLDARMLATLAATLAPGSRPPTPARLEALQDLVQARDSAVAEGTSLRNQLASADTEFLKEHLKRRVARLQQDITELEREIVRMIRADPSTARRFGILVSIPGVGPVVAAALLARLTELGTCDEKQIAMLAGLAPVADESGQRRGQRTIRGGRPAVRRMLYLAALSARRYNTPMKMFFERLIGKGKSPKVALTALARKLLVLANTLVAQDRPWEPAPPKAA